ncbi:MAG: hypothetical protein LQ348_005215 [Seirophora lacunosa]|nr:MAG: hypothetical protein LQ348_005215 [Seirophora lacunosa]
MNSSTVWIVYICLLAPSDDFIPSLNASSSKGTIYVRAAMQSPSGEQHTSLQSLFATANKQRHKLDAIPDSSSAAYQDSLRSTLAAFHECRQLTDRLAIFSPNETEDDISSADLQYLLVNHFLAELMLKDCITNRKTVLQQARAAYDRYLKTLDQYDMLSKADSKLYQRYLSERDDFSLLSNSDPAARRNTKVTRYRQEQELKLKLEYLARVPLALQNDDAASREIYLAEIQLCTHNTFHALDIINQELKIISLMPLTSPAPQPEELTQDYRQRNGLPKDDYSDRLDLPISQLMGNGKAGPLLSKDGKPLRPFTLLDSRQRLKEGVFRQDHALPTMTMDEYLEEERRRGGIIDGGGGQQDRTQPVDEDDLEKSDMETMKAREWDEYVEANPKGSGNTLNRG